MAWQAKNENTIAMKKVPILLLISTLPLWLAAQQAPKFKVEVSTDSVLWGNYFKVTYTLENAPGAQFETPAFPDFRIISGPNMSSSFSLVNGVSTQSVSYTYFLEPKEIGVFYIQPAFVETGGAVLETPPLQIKVAPNPDNIKQQPREDNSRFQFRWDDFGFPPMPESPAPKPAPEPEKKRKTTRL